MSVFVFQVLFINEPTATKICTLSLHDALPIFVCFMGLFVHCSPISLSVNSKQPQYWGLTQRRGTDAKTQKELGGKKERGIEYFQGFLLAFWVVRRLCDNQFSLRSAVYWS